MKQTLLPLIGIFGAIAIVAYVLIFSRQAEIATLTKNAQSSPNVQAVIASPSLPVHDVVAAQEPERNVTTTAYHSANGVISFAYPDYFVVKQSDPDCSFCPELVLENGDERLWFGTLPPGATTHCEEIVQHHELPSGETTIIWYEYESPDTEECSQAGNIHGFKASVEVEGTTYYVDYLPDPLSSSNHEVLFLEIARSLRVATSDQPAK